MNTFDVAGIQIGTPDGGNSAIGNGVLAWYKSADAKVDELEKGGQVVIRFGAPEMLNDGIRGDNIVLDSDDYVRNRAEAIGYIAERYFEHNVVWQPVVPKALALKALNQTVGGYHKQIHLGYSRGNGRTNQDKHPTFAAPEVE